MALQVLNESDFLREGFITEIARKALLRMRLDVACVAAVFLDESLAHETLVENLVAGMVVLEVLHEFVVARELLEAEVAVESVKLPSRSRFCSWFGFIGVFFEVREILVGCELLDDVVLFLRSFRWSFIANCRS
jgi:hypothetical protein